MRGGRLADLLVPRQAPTQLEAGQALRGEGEKNIYMHRFKSAITKCTIWGILYSIYKYVDSFF